MKFFLTKQQLDDAEDFTVVGWRGYRFVKHDNVWIQIHLQPAGKMYSADLVGAVLISIPITEEYV